MGAWSSSIPKICASEASAFLCRGGNRALLVTRSSILTLRRMKNVYGFLSNRAPIP